MQAKDKHQSLLEDRNDLKQRLDAEKETSAVKLIEVVQLQDELQASRLRIESLTLSAQQHEGFRSQAQETEIVLSNEVADLKAQVAALTRAGRAVEEERLSLQRHRDEAALQVCCRKISPREKEIRAMKNNCQFVYIS